MSRRPHKSIACRLRNHGLSYKTTFNERSLKDWAKVASVGYRRGYTDSNQIHDTGIACFLGAHEQSHHRIDDNEFAQLEFLSLGTIGGLLRWKSNSQVVVLDSPGYSNSPFEETKPADEITH